MKAPETHLRELLYSYDCVTIPELGGFIMHHQHARIDRDKGRIYPPGRYPSFNGLLVHDDGLLISAIAQDRKISYHEASAEVSRFAGHCKNDMLNGNIVKLEEIGELTLNIKGAILFNPLASANYYTGSYGMGSLSLFPQVAERQKARLNARPADRKPGSMHPKQSKSVKWTLALSVPVILFLLYGIFFPASVQTFHADISGLANQLSFTKKIQDPIRIPDANEFRLAEDVTASHEPLLDDSETLSIPGDEPAAQTDEDLVVVKLPVDRFHVIGGCFENHANAGRFLGELINRGFNAREAGANAKGHLRISYGSFAERPSALAYLDKIRKEENPAAWLLVY